MRVHVVYDPGVEDGVAGNVEAVYAEDREDVARVHADALSLSVSTQVIRSTLPEWVAELLRAEGKPYRRTKTGRWRR